MPIEIVAKPSDWTSIDAERWAAFLETETGKRLIPNLAETAPGLLASGDVNAILIRAGEVRGFQSVLREMISLAHPPAKLEERVTESYPSLTDDSKWEDGQKLQPETPNKSE
jgi:hypothetical protein